MFGFVSQSFRAGQRPVIIVTDPNVLPNLQIWYNSDLGTTLNFNQNYVSGDPISQWKDRSSFGRNLNQSGNASVKPKWIANQAGIGSTLGVVRFNGTSESLNINPVTWLHNITGFSIFIVAKASTVGVSTRTICASSTGEFSIAHNSSFWRVGIASAVGVSTITGIGDTSKYNIYGLVYDGSAVGNASRVKFRYNKTPQTLTFTGTASTITNASSTNFNVGIGSLSDYFVGDVAEVIMFTRPLNSSEIGGVESYMTAHWNI